MTGAVLVAAVVLAAPTPTKPEPISEKHIAVPSKDTSEFQIESIVGGLEIDRAITEEN